MAAFAALAACGEPLFIGLEPLLEGALPVCRGTP
jgi:hypothetical protein